MSSFRTYPGLWLKATKDHGPHIKEGQTYQLICANQRFTEVFTFAGVPGIYRATGKGWEPVYEYDEHKESQDG